MSHLSDQRSNIFTTARGGSRKTSQPDSPASLSYLALYRSSPVELIKLIRSGVPASRVKSIVSDLRLDQKSALRALNLKTATINRKTLKNESLSIGESERVIGMARLVGQLQSMMEESGDPQFDAPAWLSRWLREPLPALGGQRPLELLDTMEGQALVANILAKLQSGAYA